MNRKIQQGIKIGILFGIVLICGFSGWFFYGKYIDFKGAEKTVNLEEEKEAKDFISIPEGELRDDLRLNKYTYINLTERMKKGDFIDIRISFSNGADFILLSKKQIEDIYFGSGEMGMENALWLYMTEEEILRMSSGVVDAYLNEGSKIYAIQYVSEIQKEAYMNYPVNDVVGQLIAENPNIVEKAENVLEWSMWKEITVDENYPGEPEGASVGEISINDDNIFSNTDTREDEIIYFD